MGSRKNKHSLSRHIPNKIKQIIRQRCGFGCVICGSALYEFEHFDPEFSDAKIHDPSGITLLCPSCHASKTRGLWSVEKIRKFNNDPYCMKTGVSTFSLDVSAHPLTVKIHNLNIVDTKVVFRIIDSDLFSVIPPEEPNSPPLITAFFYNRSGERIASINNNIWNGDTSSFDIISSGNRLQIKSSINDIDLELEVSHPNIIQIKKMNLRYKGHEINVKHDGFQIRRDDSYLNIAPDVENTIYAQPFAFIATKSGFNYSSGTALSAIMAGEKSVGPFETNGFSIDIQLGTESNGFPIGQPFTKLTRLQNGQPQEFCIGPVSFSLSEEVD